MIHYQTTEQRYQNKTKSQIPNSKSCPSRQSPIPHTHLHRILIPRTQTNRPLNPAQAPIRPTAITIAHELHAITEVPDAAALQAAGIARRQRVRDHGAVFPVWDGEGVADGGGRGPGFGVGDAEAGGEEALDEGEGGAEGDGDGVADGVAVGYGDGGGGGGGGEDDGGHGDAGGC